MGLKQPDLWSIMSDLERDLCKALTSTLAEHCAIETSDELVVVQTSNEADKQAIELLAELDLAEIKNTTGKTTTAELDTRHTN